MKTPKRRVPLPPTWGASDFLRASDLFLSPEKYKRIQELLWSELPKLPPDFPTDARLAFGRLLRKGCDPTTVRQAGWILGRELGKGKWRGPKQSEINLLGRCASAVRGLLRKPLFNPNTIPLEACGPGLERFQWAALIRLLPITLEVYQCAATAAMLLVEAGVPRNFLRYETVRRLVDHVREVTGEAHGTLLCQFISGFARSPYSRQRLEVDYKRAKEMSQGPSPAAIERAGKRRLKRRIKGDSRGK